MSLYANELGDTHLRTSTMGLGLAALGRPGYINLGHVRDLEENYEPETMERRAHAVLDTAYQAGVRYFDAARSYGRAEAFLASWLKARRIVPDSVVVASKWGYTYTAAWRVDATVHEVKEHSLQALQRQWQETQAHLSDHLRLYQIHSATLESGVLENAEILAELGRLKHAAGVAIGLSVSGPRQAEVIDRALEVVVDGRCLFDTVQATWNLLERSAGPALRNAANAGMGIIVKEGLANGRLTQRNTLAADFQKLRLIQEQADLLNTTVDALALAAVLAQPWVSVVLSGAATIAHLRSNLRALLVGWNEDVAFRLSSVAEPATEYWQKRSSLRWN